MLHTLYPWYGVICKNVGYFNYLVIFTKCIINKCMLLFFCIKCFVYGDFNLQQGRRRVLKSGPAEEAIECLRHVRGESTRGG